MWTRLWSSATDSLLSLVMYIAGFASEQNEENPAGKELPAFFSEEKQPPSVAFLWNNEDSYFFTQLVVMGLLAFSRFKPPFACAPDHFFSLTAAVVPKKVVQKSLNVPYTDF